MNFSLVLAALVVVTVNAGFCDSYSSNGYRCDGSTAKYCSCKSSTKCEKKQQSCSSGISYPSDTGCKCSYGCSTFTSGGCRSAPTPPPADKLCATSTVLASTAEGTICPIITTASYKLWKDTDTAQKADAVLRVQATLLEEEQIEMNIFVTSNETLYPVPASITAAFASCKATLVSYACRRNFPECRMDGLTGEGFNTNCEADCAKIDMCMDTAYAACQALPSTAANTTRCASYAEMYPDQVMDDGSRNCVRLCAFYQNDYVASAGSVSPAALLLASLLALAFTSAQ